MTGKKWDRWRSDKLVNNNLKCKETNVSFGTGLISYQEDIQVPTSEQDEIHHEILFSIKRRMTICHSWQT